MNEVFSDLTTILKIYMTFLLSYEAERKFSISHKNQFLLIILKNYLSILYIKDVFTKLTSYESCELLCYFSRCYDIYAMCQLCKICNLLYSYYR